MRILDTAMRIQDPPPYEVFHREAPAPHVGCVTTRTYVRVLAFRPLHAARTRRHDQVVMTEDRFFRGFLATLAERIRYIDARDDRHQEALHRALATLHELQVAGRPGATTMPKSLRPGIITGKYDEFDDALLNFQDWGYDSAQNPFYASVELTLPERRIKRVLSRFSQDERDTFVELANSFLKSSSSVESTA